MAAGSAGISLHVTQRMLVAGETVHGEVRLDTPLFSNSGVQTIIDRISGSVDVYVELFLFLSLVLLIFWAWRRYV